MSHRPDSSYELDGLPGAGSLLEEKYRLGERLGVGGMGVVFAGEHVHLEQPVAVKMLLPRVALMPGARARFVREARAAAKIPGEHAVRILDVDTTKDGIAYMIMERLTGEDLGALLADRGRLPPTLVADLMVQALEAIEAAHAAGIVHRDIKPSNLFLATVHDGRQIVKVLDFGISKTLTGGEDAKNTLTDPNAPIGSPQYMAPEQITDGRTVDGRADLWSLGVVMYELLTGQAPFEAETISYLYVKILHEEPAPIGRLVPGIPTELESAVMACLVKDRKARMQTAADLRDSLLPFASPLTRGQRTPRPEADVPSFRAATVSVRVGAPGTSDAQALDATLVAPRAWSRVRLLLAIGGVIAVAVLVYAGLRKGTPEADANVSAPSDAVAPPPSVTVIPGPSVTASTPAGQGANAPTDPVSPALQTSSPTAAAAEPPSPAAGASPKPRATQTPSTSSQPAPPRVKELRDIRPLE